MVRAPRSVGTFSATLNLSGESSCTTVSTPSPQEANASSVSGSNAVASTPSPIGSVVTSFPAVGIHDGHQLVAASGKQPPMFAIDGQSSRFFARRQRPARLYLQLVRIERHQLALVFDIHENFAFFVTDRKLRLPIQLDRADHRRPWPHRWPSTSWLLPLKVKTRLLAGS